MQKADLPRQSKGVSSEGGIHQLYILAESITATNSSSSSSEWYSLHLSYLNLPINHEISGNQKYTQETIKSLIPRGCAGILPTLVASLCPRIFGHELVRLSTTNITV